MLKGIAYMLIVLLLAAGPLACGDESDPGSEANASRRKRLAPKPPPPPVAVDAEEQAEYSEEGTEEYLAQGRRDPFRSFRFKEDAPFVAQGPLADFDLSQLVIVGLVWSSTNPRVLISDPGGQSFVLQEGSHIGKNNGQVIRIDRDMILVQEKFVDFDGAVSAKDIEMRIRKSQGG